MVCCVSVAKRKADRYVRRRSNPAKHFLSHLPTPAHSVSEVECWCTHCLLPCLRVVNTEGCKRVSATPVKPCQAFCPTCQSSDVCATPHFYMGLINCVPHLAGPVQTCARLASTERGK